VLRDAPFSIWVTGKGPKRRGFSLDARSKADCRFRLEVEGKVEIASELIYLRAKASGSWSPPRGSELCPS
jgi:hypothetical protein